MSSVWPACGAISHGLSRLRPAILPDASSCSDERDSNLSREIRTEFGSRQRDAAGPIETCCAKSPADPNFLRAGIEVQGHLFPNFFIRIARRSDFNTNFRAADKN